jgi:alkylhydroperoxidase family enzyme
MLAANSDPERRMSARQPITGQIETDHAARQAHVVGEGPRIAPVPHEEVSEESREQVNRVRAGAGVGPVDRLPLYMRVVLKQPDLFRWHMELGSAVFAGRLPPRDRELAVLRIARLSQSPYEWGEHVDIAQRFGRTAEEAARVTQGSSAAGWSEHDAAILRGVEELLADYALSDATWEVLARTWDEAQLVEYLMMIGHYVSVAFVQNSLRIPLAGDNPGLSHR